MDTNLLEEVLSYWSYWVKAPPKTVPRLVQLPEVLDPSLLIAIQGVRRCGKSTLLGQLVKHYRLDRKRCVFVNFEDTRLHGETGPRLLFQIVEYFTRKFDDKEPLYFFFDEIQEVSGWEKWIHTKFERPGREFYFVTGSNASLLSGELSTSLTGRYRVVELFPFSYQEARRIMPKLDIQTYLAVGGFPKAVEGQGDVALLQQYYRDIVERDITNRVGARSSDKVLAVIQMIFESGGSEISQRKIGGTLGLSADTVGNYISAAESAYIIGSCPFFAYSTKKQRVRNNKYYAIDSGIRRAATGVSDRDLGKDLELAVYWKLKRRFKEVYYWRNNHEVDFVVQLGKDLLPIQVTWSEIKERHEKGLGEFYETFQSSLESIFITQKDMRDDFQVIDNL